MKRTTATNADPNANGSGKSGYKEAVPGVSAGTTISAADLNMLQEEICNAIEIAGGVALDGSSKQQLADVLAALVGGVGGAASISGHNTFTGENDFTGPVDVHAGIDVESGDLRVLGGSGNDILVENGGGIQVKDGGGIRVFAGGQVESPTYTFNPGNTVAQGVPLAVMKNSASATRGVPVDGGDVADFALHLAPGWTGGTLDVMYQKGTGGSACTFALRELVPNWGSPGDPAVNTISSATGSAGDGAYEVVSLSLPAPVASGAHYILRMSGNSTSGDYMAGMRVRGVTANNLIAKL